MYFAKIMSKTIGKNKSKNLSGKYSSVMLAASQKLLDHAKNLRQTTSKTAIKKAEANVDFIANKTADKTTELARISPKNSSETVTD